jgi:hypothetical protein
MYTIYRFYRKEGKKPKVIKKGLTLKEAKKHCCRPDTEEFGVWFDGFTKE